MQAHHECSLKCTEQHPVSGILWVQGFLFVNPGPAKFTAGRIGYALGVALVPPTGPEHAQTACLGAKQERTIGNLSRQTQSVGQLSYGNHLTRPWSLGSFEKRKRDSLRPAQISLQTHCIHRTVDALQPLMTINHIGDTIFHPKGSIKGRLRGRSVLIGKHHGVGTLRVVGHKDMRGSAGNVIPSGNTLNNNRSISKGAEKIILSLIQMKLCGPNLWTTSHPRPGIRTGDRIRTLPHHQIFALP